MAYSLLVHVFFPDSGVVSVVAVCEEVSIKRCGTERSSEFGSVHHLRCPHARARDERRFQRALTQTDLLGPPGRCSGCWPHDGEVDGCAVEIFVLVNLVVRFAPENYRNVRRSVVP